MAETISKDANYYREMLVQVLRSMPPFPKDTFHLAWRKLGAEYSIIPHRPVALDHYIVLLQFDPEGERLFQHRCNSKWTITERTLRVLGFLYEEECLASLRELQARWPGRVAEPPFKPQEQTAVKDD